MKRIKVYQILIMAFGIGILVHILPHSKPSQLSIRTTSSDELVLYDLSNNGLSILPWQEIPKNVEILFLTNNKFTEVPDLSTFSRLSRLSLKGNRISVFDCEKLPPAIRHLILTDNAISKFTGNCEHTLREVKKLMLTRNRLLEFPFSRLESIELLRVAENNIATVPMLFVRNSLNLKWISLGGNPCFPISTHQKTLREFTQPCEHKIVLGKGTSGKAYACIHNENSEADYVVKEFVSKSSDGSNKYEVYVASAVPVHSALLTPMGMQNGNLVYPFIRNARPAALPPDIVTVTKDRLVNISSTFPQFEQYVKQLACGVLELHRANIVHMDIYAHNVIVVDTKAILLDFGAAMRKSAKISQVDFDFFKILDERAFLVLVRDLASSLQIRETNLLLLLLQSGKLSLQQICHSLYNEKAS